MGEIWTPDNPQPFEVVPFGPPADHRRPPPIAVPAAPRTTLRWVAVAVWGSLAWVVLLAAIWVAFHA